MSTPAESSAKPAGESRKPPKAKRGKSPYFSQPAAGGGVTVYRRPVGNRALPTVCGTLPTQAKAAAFVAQLRKAESVVDDLFLEATDDGIEALEAILRACREAVLQASDARPRKRNRRGDRRRD
jgi:hypothetical protein